MFLELGLSEQEFSLWPLASFMLSYFLPVLMISRFGLGNLLPGVAGTAHGLTTAPCPATRVVCTLRHGYKESSCIAGVCGWGGSSQVGAGWNFLWPRRSLRHQWKTPGGSLEECCWRYFQQGRVTCCKIKIVKISTLAKTEVQENV